MTGTYYLGLDIVMVLTIRPVERPLPDLVRKPLLFLAGPAPRNPQVASWRTEAIRILTNLKFGGTVILPEPVNFSFSFSGQQLEWEWEMADRADIIAFWIPRDLQTMPGFTTNVEFGLWARQYSLVLGCPRNTPHMKYLLHTAALLGIPKATTLRHTMQLAIAATQAN